MKIESRSDTVEIQVKIGASEICKWLRSEISKMAAAKCNEPELCQNWTNCWQLKNVIWKLKAETSHFPFGLGLWGAPF